MREKYMYGVFSGPYSLVFGLQSKHVIMRTRKNSMFGHFSCHVKFTCEECELDCKNVRTRIKECKNEIKTRILQYFTLRESVPG